MARFCFAPNMVQKWENKPGMPVNRSLVLNTFYNGTINQEDRDVVEFLFVYRYATGEQLERCFSQIFNLSQLKKRLNIMMKYRLVNRFRLVNPNNPNEASCFIYCMDLGGMYLLSNFSNQLDNLLNWTSADNMRSAELVGRDLVATEFFVLLKEALPQADFKYILNKELQIDKKKFIPTFVLEINDKVILGEVVRGSEQLDLLDDRLVRYDYFIETKKHLAYFNAKPILFFVAEDDVLALKIAEKVERLTRIANFRLTTDARLERGLAGKGAFLKYENNILIETTSKMFRGVDDAGAIS